MGSASRIRGVYGGEVEHLEVELRGSGGAGPDSLESSTWRKACLGWAGSCYRAAALGRHVVSCVQDMLAAAGGADGDDEDGARGCIGDVAAAELAML